MHAGFTLTVLTVDGPVKVQLPCNLDDDMNIVIENKGVPYADGRGIHHVSWLPWQCLLIKNRGGELYSEEFCFFT